MVGVSEDCVEHRSSQQGPVRRVKDRQCTGLQYCSKGGTKALLLTERYSHHSFNSCYSTGPADI
jgi:hypothetical protein